MRVALIGADGQLGTDLFRQLKERYQVFPLYYPDFDITRLHKVGKNLSSMRPEIVINTAAYNRVDESETNPQEAFHINALSVRDLAILCRELGAVLVHFSTDYVFDGKRKKAYTEDDPPNPVNVYGVSKLAGEYFIRNTLDEFYLIRTCGLFGLAGCWGKGANFVDAMISSSSRGEVLKVVNDQWVTPTATLELAQKVGELLQTKSFGLYHLTNEGQCTWFQFAKAIFAFMQKSPEIQPINSLTFKAKARRPAFSVLENKRAKEIGLSGFSSWETALKDYLERKGHLG